LSVSGSDRKEIFSGNGDDYLPFGNGSDKKSTTIIKGRRRHFKRLLENLSLL
jgi:hypothetical protein